MQIDVETTLLQNIHYLPSPHYNERPKGAEINLLVVHGISLPPGEFGGEAIKQLFMGKLAATDHVYFASIAHLRVSAHVLIRRTGEVLQFVPFSKRAWHAGESIFQGQPDCNNYSIGVELEGTDSIPYEQIQYQRLNELIHCLQQIYPGITNERIIGHSDIAPGRKTDPGPAFDWNYLRSLEQKAL